MVARINFSSADVVRILGLSSREAVDELVAKKLLDVAAFTRTGQPLFDAEAVRRAAARVVGGTGT